MKVNTSDYRYILNLLKTLKLKKVKSKLFSDIHNIADGKYKIKILRLLK